LGGDKVVAEYLVFRADGGFQDAWVILKWIIPDRRPSDRDKAPFDEVKPNRPNLWNKNEVPWIAPIYPGRTLYFDSTGGYLGGSGGGKAAFVPPKNNLDEYGKQIEVVRLQAGTGLLFKAPGGNTVGKRFFDESGPFLDSLTPAQAKVAKPEKNQVLVIVPPMKLPKPPKVDCSILDRWMSSFFR